MFGTQENMPPRVLLQTNNAGTDIGRIGDCIGLKGDLTNGVLLFGGKTSLGKPCGEIYYHQRSLQHNTYNNKYGGLGKQGDVFRKLCSCTIR